VLLAARGQQPWRIMTFLDDARERGLLRQSGAVYQFRHAMLCEHLAGKALQAEQQAQGPEAQADPDPHPSVAGGPVNQKAAVPAAHRPPRQPHEQPELLGGPQLRAMITKDLFLA
jgi:hypothetical protein